MNGKKWERHYIWRDTRHPEEVSQIYGAILGISNRLNIRRYQKYADVLHRRGRYSGVTAYRSRA